LPVVFRIGEPVMGKYQHKQVRAKYPDGPTVWVDEGMKSFLEALWDRGIDTILSCQENMPGIAWVEFLTPDDAICFLELAWSLADDEMRERIEGEWVVPGMWDCNALQEYLGNGRFTLSVGLRLPIEDKDRLAEWLAELQEAHAAADGEDMLIGLTGSKENAA
jgi:hypothetical protein